jgi:hypothetical protein
MWIPLFAILSMAGAEPSVGRSGSAALGERTADPRAESSTLANGGDDGDAGDSFEPVAARGLHMMPAVSRSLSKKEDWLRDKGLRPDYHMTDDDLAAVAKTAATEKPRRRSAAELLSGPMGRPGERITPITTLFNVWTKEALPVLPGAWVEDRFHRFVRDHYTNQATWMDTRLIAVLAGAARRFSAERIEIVSGYRSPKYNLILRKKGHQVARQSQHTEGHAVDFRIPGVPTQTLLGYVRSLRLGGVGFYPHSRFVHSDTGRVRYWTGS